MLEAFLTTLEQMTRILMFVLLGFVLNRAKLLPKSVGEGISRMVTILFLPALKLYSNMTEFHLSEVGSYIKLILWGGAFWLLITLLSYPVAKKLSGGNEDDQSIYLYGLSFSNTGSVGDPLVLGLFGTAGLFKYNLFVLIISSMTYAWGVGLFMDKGKKRSIRRVIANVFNPVFVAIIIGLILGAVNADNWMPDMVLDFTSSIANCYVPVSLISAGFAMAEYPIGEIISSKKAYIFSALRLIVIPIFALVIAWCLGFSQMMAIMVVLSFAGPSGMNVVVYPAAYGRDCKSGAAIVLISSIASILTVPLIYALMQLFFK